MKKRYVEPLKEQFLHICEYLSESEKHLQLSVKQNLRELNSKLDKLEERFALGEIDRQIFDQVGQKLRTEIASAKDAMKDSIFELSNPLKSFQISLIFGFRGIIITSVNYKKYSSGGILFDRQVNNYRTPQINTILTLTRSLSNNLEENKNGQTKFLSDLPDLVVPIGFEPMTSALSTLRSKPAELWD
jgi:site-specific DNA recombinase